MKTNLKNKMPTHQSKIQKLITELCPEGVEFKKLGELEDSGLIKLGRGNVISKKDISETPGDYPVYSSSAAGSGEIGRYGKYMFDDERITWSIDGGGRLFYRPASKYSVTNVSGWLKNLDESKINTKYLYFALTDEWVKKIFDYTHKAHPSVIRNEYKISLPPLAVQEEVVRILNGFAELEVELEVELDVRKKQYDYYREKLLTFGDDVEWKALSEVCDYVDYRGKTPKKTGSGVFLVTAKNIRRGYIDYAASQEFISENDYNLVMRRGLPEIGDILITTEAPCGFVAQVDQKNIALAQRVIKYRSKNELFSNSFLKHYLLGNQFQAKLAKTSTGATVKGIKGSKLHKLTIPLPIPAEQERIVSILDKFDALVNDISIGLPAELSARKQQYEYYREKLLIFKEYVK